MKGASFVKKLAMLAAFAVAAASLTLAQTEQQPKKKKPAMIPGPGAQTAPADNKPQQGQKGTQPGQKGKAKPPDPAQAGWMTVKGRIVTVQPDRKAVIIRTDTTDYQVFVTTQTKLTRDGKATDIKELQVNDRVESCHFNAKRAVETLKVISVEKGLVPQPNPERQEPASKKEPPSPKAAPEAPKEDPAKPPANRPVAL